MRLAEAQHADKPWLAASLSACTTGRHKGVVYVHFVDPANANQPGAAWQFAGSLWLSDPTEGNVVVDVLVGGRVGGIEFYDRLFSDGAAKRRRARARRKGC